MVRATERRGGDPAVADAVALGAVDGVEVVGRRSTSWRTHTITTPGIATPSTATERLRSNLRDEVIRLLLGVLFVAQLADLWTTHVALNGGALMERNPLFRPLFASLPGLADGVKLGAVLVLATVALSALPVPRSRHALLLAAAMSIVAPISNLMMLAGHI